MMFPVWAKIQHDFDQEQVKAELLRNEIFDKSIVATTNYNQQGHSVWDPQGTAFAEELFQKQKLIHHYVERDGDRVLINGSYNTFRMLNLTHLPDLNMSGTESWEGKLSNNDKIPLWIKYTDPWHWRSDLDLPFTRSVVESLPIEYPLTVRCVIQDPPSIGVVHKDSGPKINEDFYKRGFGSITLNIADGGANLWFINHRTGQKFKVDESQHKCWHFDDACLHCTTEVVAKRIQLRVFAKFQKSYMDLLMSDGAVF